MLDEDKSSEELLSFYMGKNTPDRQSFIINNLKCTTVSDSIISREVSDIMPWHGIAMHIKTIFDNQ